MSSKNLDKYEHSTSEDLNYKPSTVEQAKFDYSPLSKFFNKGLKEDKKEGLLKSLKNIEDKSEEQLKATGNKTDIKSQIDIFDKDLTQQVIALIKEIRGIEDNVDYDKLSFKDIFNKNTTIYKAKIKQNKYAEKLDKLRVYPARGCKYIDFKESVSNKVKNFMTDGKKLFMGLKMEYYHFLKRMI